MNKNKNIHNVEGQMFESSKCSSFSMTKLEKKTICAKLFSFSLLISYPLPWGCSVTQGGSQFPFLALLIECFLIY